MPIPLKDSLARKSPERRAAIEADARRMIAEEMGGPSEMVERVARAIGEMTFGYVDPADTPNTWGIAIAAAEAAIAAMREPTAEMLRGGLCGWNGVGIDHELSKFQSAEVTWDAWRRAWRGMIDEALK